jgi:hypothetical protein
MYSWSAGPQQLATTGDGSFSTLFGAAWMAQVCPDGSWRLYQRTAPASLTGRVWDVTPPAVPVDARHPTLAFDQAARPSLAWEQLDGIHLRVFDAPAGVYQFIGPIAGHDPALLMDAEVANPADYPDAERAAFDAGIPVLLEWLPEPAWRTNVIPDSDLVLFHLSADRERVIARAQRELFLTVHEIHDFEQPVVLDLATALHGHYQLHVSDQYGEPLPESLISDPYLGELIINPRVGDVLVPDPRPETVEVTRQTALTLAEHDAVAAIDPETVEVTRLIHLAEPEHDATGATSPEGAVVTAMIYPLDELDLVDADAAPEGVRVEARIVIEEAQHDVEALTSPETVRVQRAA